MAFEFQGDGRRREAKRLKSKTFVDYDEIELESKIKSYQDENPRI